MYIQLSDINSPRRAISMRGLQTNEQLAADLQATLEAKLKGYEIILSKQKYLAGDVSTNHYIS